MSGGGGDSSNAIAAGINFKITGENPPSAINLFSSAGLRPLLLENLSKCGYMVPTRVQKCCLPIIMEGRDLMAMAQTGEGKTAAFLLPILHKLMESQADNHDGEMVQAPQCVIITPTRELTLQIKDEAQKFSKGSRIKCVVVYGGTSVEYQLSQLEKGCNILICTPGRMMDLVDQEKVTFENLKYLVLDEADRLLDMHTGLRKDIGHCIAASTMPPKGERQTLMFSATFPDQIQKTAQELLAESYLFVHVRVVQEFNKEHESKQQEKREKGNFFFEKFLKSSAGKRNPASARDNILSAMTQYEEALEISKKHSVDHGVMSACKNLAVTAGYIAEIEPNNNNKLARFKEAVQYFSQSLFYCRQVQAADDFQWRMNLIPGMKKVVESFFKFLQESGIKDDVKNKVCEEFVKGFDNWSEDWVELSVMAEVRVKQAEMLNNLAVANIADKIFKAGLSHIAEAWRPLELARKYSRKLSFVPNSGPIKSEIQILKNKTLEGVNDAIEKVMEMKDEVKEAEKLKMIAVEMDELKRSVNSLEDELKRMEQIMKASDEISENLEDIWKECSTHKAVGEGLQMASQGEQTLKIAVAGDETLQMEMVWDAMDMFKQAIILSAGEEIELETMAKGKIGLIYLKVLKNEPQARDYLTEAMDTAKVMLLERNINLYDFDWYGEVADGYNQIQGEKVRQEDEEWAKERTPLLEDPFVKLALKSLEDHAEDDDEEFAKFLFDFLPPKHRDDCESLKKSLETGFNEGQKKMLQKMVTFWHQDRVKKEEDKKHYVICEEVTKILTIRYERLKE